MKTESNEEAQLNVLVFMMDVTACSSSPLSNMSESKVLSSHV